MPPVQDPSSEGFSKLGLLLIVAIYIFLSGLAIPMIPRSTYWDAMVTAGSYAHLTHKQAET